MTVTSLARGPRAAVIGAGLGGLAAALRLHGLGFDVTVLEQRTTPGGRASQLRTDGFTWDTGPSLITMPWVLEETFAAGGLDLHSEVRLRRLDPLYRIRWAGEERAFDFTDSIERLRSQIAAFDAGDARRLDGFLAALRPIYEQGILAAGRKPFTDVREFARLVPQMARLNASSPATSATRACGRPSRSTRCSSAGIRSACRPSTAGSSTCSCSTAAGTRTAASTRWWRRWRGP
jgi:phytoene desaturase